MTKMDTMSAFEGTTTTIEKPKTRAQKVAEYRTANQRAYEKACHDSQCTCTPTRAEMLIMENYQHPPID